MAEGGASGGGETPAAADPAAAPAAGAAGDPPASAAAADGGATGGAAGGSESAGSTGATGASGTSEPKPADWRDKRIATLTAQLRATQQARGPAATPPVEPATASGEAAVPASEVERLANERATAIAEAANFNARCEATAAAGMAAYGQEPFQARVTAIRNTMDMQNPAENQIFLAFLDAAMETGKGHDVLFALGTDLNEASRIMGLSPARMGAALARKADALAVANAASGSGAAAATPPKPVTPVGGRGGSREVIAADDKDRADTLNVADWMARREEQLNARRAAR